ncbi:MAG: hypothetical protein IME93_06685 [Proteobacteria bacterium]|nr:hypothetical protein [Pseudomonadota bacterium]
MMAVTGLFIFLFGWLCLPFLPGIIEIRKKTDASPLKVVQEYDVDVHYFANVFRAYVKQHFSGLISSAHAAPKAVQGKLEDDTQYFVLNNTHKIPLQESEKQLQFTHSMLVSTDSLQLPGAMSYLTELYASDSIYGGEENIYRALLAENDIEIAEGSMLLRWMHAGHSIDVKPHSVLHGRVSADHSINLKNNCHFERLYAPTILFGDSIPQHQEQEQANLNKLSPDDLAHDIETKGDRWLIEHDIDIPDNSLIDCNVVVIGRLKIGKGCRINGSVKSRKVLYVGEGTVITGSLVSNKNIYCLEKCCIAGPVISEESIYLDSSSIVGAAEKPTTISAEEIHIKTNTVAYGSVWARQTGVVREAEA